MLYSIVFTHLWRYADNYTQKDYKGLKTPFTTYT